MRVPRAAAPVVQAEGVTGMETTYLINIATGEARCFASRDEAKKQFPSGSRHVRSVRQQKEIEEWDDEILLRVYNQLTKQNVKRFSDRRTTLDRAWAAIVGCARRISPTIERQPDPANPMEDDTMATKKAVKKGAKKAGTAKPKQDHKIKVLHKGDNPWRNGSVAFNNWTKIKDGMLVSAAKAAGVRSLDILRAVKYKHISLSPVKSAA